VDYNWPGNVRELENVIERAYALGVTETIAEQDLPTEIKGKEIDSEEMPANMTFKDHEIYLIRKAMRMTNNSKADAAILLGVNITTVYRMIARYGLSFDKRSKTGAKGS